MATDAPTSTDFDDVILVDTETMTTTTAPQLGLTCTEHELDVLESGENDGTTQNSGEAIEVSEKPPCRKVTLCVGERVVIGRASKTNEERTPEFDNLLFYNAHLSKVHAEIEYRPGFFIKDLDSTFGTVVNGLVLAPEESYELADGDIIGLIMLRPLKKIMNVFDKFATEKVIPLNEFGSPELGLKKRVSIVGNALELFDVDGAEEDLVSQSESSLELVSPVTDLVQLSESEVSESEESGSDYSSGPDISYTQIIFDSFSDEEGSTYEEEELQTELYVVPESRKRSFLEIDDDSFVALVPEDDPSFKALANAPPPKRQKTETWSLKTVAKEVGKAFFYTIATVAALGLYGSTIDPQK